MVQINFALKEVNCKIVYYGPGMSGKTTNLEVVHRKAPEANKGELTSIATEGDRTLFFDFMPLDLGNIAGMRTKFQLYTVPGQVYYNSTRKLVLQGVDGIIFVADSQEGKMDENLESMANLRNNLAEYGKKLDLIPMVIQYNKRDLNNVISVEELNEQLNARGAPWFEGVATTGEGVFPTLKALSAMVLESLSKEKRPTTVAPQRKPAAEAAPAAQEEPVAAREPVAASAGAEPAPVQQGAGAGEEPRRPEPRPDRVAAEVGTAPEKPLVEPQSTELPPVGGTIRPSRVGPAASTSTRLRTGAAAYGTSPSKAARKGAEEAAAQADDERTPAHLEPPPTESEPVAAEAAPSKAPRSKPKAAPLVQKYVLEEERGSPALLAALVLIILAAAGVILYSFNVI